MTMGTSRDCGEMSSDSAQVRRPATTVAFWFALGGFVVAALLLARVNNSPGSPDSCGNLMLARNLIYTGVTRGKKLVVLVGQRKALAIAVKNGGTRRRWSKLKEWLS